MKCTPSFKGMFTLPLNVHLLAYFPPCFVKKSYHKDVMLSIFCLA